MPSLTVNPASKPALMDERAEAPRKKTEKETVPPEGPTPPFFLSFFLASGPISRGGLSQAGIEAGSNKKGN
jgi:hypothetical protein